VLGLGMRAMGCDCCFPFHPGNFGLITDVPTDEGWLSLAAVLDLCTRKIIGWAMRDHMRTELSIASLMMAIQGQKPHSGLIHHSDRGSQSRKGNCVHRKLLWNAENQIRPPDQFSHAGSCETRAVCLYRRIL
jgi:transposase InsO family protein